MLNTPRMRLEARDRRKSSVTALSFLAILAVAGFVAVPLAGAYSSFAYAWHRPVESARSTLVTGAGMELSREAVNVTGGWGSLSPAGRDDPTGVQAIAFDLTESRGWDEGEFRCLVALWSRESGWNSTAQNPSSGAYGIPQALPASKMASAGADWATNPVTQIRWGLGYIDARYGSPCGAWRHSEQKGWY